jgi:hypothetical protein
VLTLYFSSTRGIKIEHERNRTTQGAATTANLLPQQQPQMKDVEQKPSAASSDEERLAAGISTIELQTKRLSGAQRKRLTNYWSV